MNIDLNYIHSRLEEIKMDMDHALDTLEGEAPDYMDFKSLRQAHTDLEEQTDFIRRWIDNFQIGDIEQRL